MANPIVLYTGPSVLDGAPIVVLATLGSSNVKTGPMVQTWIMRSDLRPVDASKSLADASVCGACPRRHSLGGDCYVLIHNAPQSAWKAWDRAGRPIADIANAVKRTAKDAAWHGVRLGAYGDPAAVPSHVWESYFSGLARAVGRTVRHTGYTHQWSSVLPADHAAWCRQNLMASCDTPVEAVRARALGWRFFAAIPATDLSNVPERTIQCLADRPESRRTCETCGICDGAGRSSDRASVYIAEHGARSGAKAKRSAALAVLS